MKKLLMILMAASVAFSCGELIEIPSDTEEPGSETPGTNPGGETVPFDGKLTFTGTFEALPDGTQPTWAGGDEILLFDGFSTQTLVNTADFGVLAMFPATVSKDAKAFLAAAPASDGFTLEGTTISFSLPASRKIGDKTAMISVAKSSGSNLFFRPLLSFINFSVGFEGATKVVIKTAAEEMIAGSVTIDYSGENPVVTAASDVVEVSGNFVKGETYSIAVPPVSISGYTVEVFTGETVKAHISGDAVDLEVGKQATLPVFAADIPTYKIAALQLWGGTGPEYDCTKVYELFSRPGCFNSEDGRGIEALKDNYFLLKDDGTFINYAGEDGRNWWFVFSGEQNTETHKDIDLRSFYDLLPLSEGKWSTSDGQNITFTKADDTETVAQLAPAGSYLMPGTKPDKYVTTTHDALVFTIKGGKDNWNGDNLWNNYGVIACHPRVLFIELEKMPDGFVVPEEARTFDADFEYIPPVDPITQFNWEDLEGSWNVYGGNSSPYGIFVLGGSGDDPAFVSPIDKSWDWDDTIWKESDNGFVIHLSGLSGTVISGTTNWWAGNDGAFWNYVWNATGEDLSRFYNKIPKGQKDFTLDVASLKMTLGNGNEAAFLIPGVHEFVYGKTLTVPDGCFGLAFHNMDPIPATSQRWTDVDRFVNAPLEYVILFEKQ